jgi:hypothetical protein
MSATAGGRLAPIRPSQQLLGEAVVAVGTLPHEDCSHSSHTINGKKSPSKIINLPKIGINEPSPKQRLNSEITKEPKVVLQPLAHATNPLPSQPAEPLLPSPHASLVRLEPLLPQTQIPALAAPVTNTSPLLESSSPSKVTSLSAEDPSAAALPLSGKVTIVYEMYREQFPIENGAISSETIDELYGLTAVMPNCSLYLSTSSPAEIRELLIAACASASCSISALPLGALGCPEWYLPFDDVTKTHQRLRANGTYFCYLREPERKDHYQASRDLSQRDVTSKDDDGRGFDCCTCIYGTPCQVRTSLCSSTPPSPSSPRRTLLPFLSLFSIRLCGAFPVI